MPFGGGVPASGGGVPASGGGMLAFGGVLASGGGVWTDGINTKGEFTAAFMGLPPAAFLMSFG